MISQFPDHNFFSAFSDFLSFFRVFIFYCSISRQVFSESFLLIFSLSWYLFSSSCVLRSMSLFLSLPIFPYYFHFSNPLQDLKLFSQSFFHVARRLFCCFRHIFKFCHVSSFSFCLSFSSSFFKTNCRQPEIECPEYMMRGIACDREVIGADTQRAARRGSIHSGLSGLLRVFRFPLFWLAFSLFHVLFRRGAWARERVRQRLIRERKGERKRIGSTWNRDRQRHRHRNTRSTRHLHSNSNSFLTNPIFWSMKLYCMIISFFYNFELEIDYFHAFFRY